MFRITHCSLAIVLSWATLPLLLFPSASQAGMPAPFTLNELPKMRLEAISFFLLVFFVCAGLVQLIWNHLRRSFDRLPRLGYWRAASLLLIWGLLFIVVLAMVSGARELMTPGAWDRHGVTYRLKGAQAK